MVINNLFFMLLIGCLTTPVYALMTCEKLLDTSTVYTLSDAGSPFTIQDGEDVMVGVTKKHMSGTLFKAYADIKNHYGREQRAVEDGSSLIFANIKPYFKLREFLNSFNWFRVQDVDTRFPKSHAYRGYFEYLENTSIHLGLSQGLSSVQSISTLESPLIVDVSGEVLGFSDVGEPILDPKSIVITYKMRVRGSMLSLIMKKLEENHLSRYRPSLERESFTKKEYVTYVNQFRTLKDFSVSHGELDNSGVQFKSRALNLNIRDEDTELFVTTQNRLPVGFVETQNFGSTIFLEFVPEPDKFYDIEIFNRPDNVSSASNYEEVNHLSNQNRMVSFLIEDILSLLE